VELLPAASVPIGLVDPGDEMYAYIEETSAGDWTIYTEDVTQGESATNYVTDYYPPEASAEWIEEAPIDGCCQANLADFGTTGFSDLGVTGTDLSSATLIPLEMVNSEGTVLAYPSAYDAGTNSFTITYGSPPPSVTSLSVSSGSTSGGTSVTVSGSNFNGAYAVEFGGVPTSFAVDSADTVTATSPAEPAGTVNVTVSTQWGISALSGSDQFTYTSPPPPPAPTPPPVTTGDLPAPIVGMAALPDGSGYWLADAQGGVSTHGNAVNYGSMAGQPLNAPISHIVATSDGKGYWLVAADGGTFAFGDAGFYGSMGGQRLNAPVVDIAPTKDDQGYWLVASDGGIFAFGDAGFHGSMGGQRLNKPVVGMSADDTTGGYWEVATDGGIFAFNAPFYGSTGSLSLNQPVNGMTSTSDNQGYWFVASDRGIFAFGDAQFFGSTGGTPLNAPIVGMTADVATGGYWMVAADGGIFAFNAPFYGAD
jgi:hypothetical protein